MDKSSPRFFTPTTAPVPIDGCSGGEFYEDYLSEKPTLFERFVAWLMAPSPFEFKQRKSRTRR